MPIKTLVIDDVRDFDESYLPDRDFTHVRNSRDGVAELETGEYASLLLDYDLSFNNENLEDAGWRVAEWLRKNLHKIPTLNEILIISTLKKKSEEMMETI